MDLKIKILVFEVQVIETFGCESYTVFLYIIHEDLKSGIVIHYLSAE